MFGGIGAALAVDRLVAVGDAHVVYQSRKGIGSHRRILCCLKRGRKIEQRRC